MPITVPPGVGIIRGVRKAVAGGGGGANAYSPAVLATTGLQHYWPAEDTSGVVLVDTKAAANGSYVGTAAAGSGAGLVTGSTKSYHADGSASAAKLPNDIVPWDSGDFSVEFMFKASTATNALFSQSGQVTLGGGVNGYASCSFYIDSIGKLRTVMFWSGDNTLQVVSSAAVNDGVVHQAAATYNNTSKVMTAYLDGASIGTLTTFNQSPYSGAYGYYLGALQAITNIQAWNSMTDGWHYGTADLGHVSTYNVVVPGATISSHWAAR